MARIVLNTWMVQYPLGGMLSYFMQWIVGFQQLGHDVYVVEKATNGCGLFNPWDGTWSDDHAYGLATVRWLLRKFRLQDRHCFVDRAGIYHGIERSDIERIFGTADLFFDIKGPGNDWRKEASSAARTAVLDGEPGSNQIWLASLRACGAEIPKYDHYFTIGLNIGTTSTAPTAGIDWKPTLLPLVPELFPVAPPPERTAPFTTVMNWKAAPELTFEGKVYGHKDVEFESFIGLPKMTSSRMEVSASGPSVPFERLRQNGWQVRDALWNVAIESYVQYMLASKGEFSVARNVYTAPNTGLFYDRTAAYMACGRPVVVQDTGFSEHLPCGEGLFAVRTAEEAAIAIEAIDRDYERHAKAACHLARELFAPERVLRPLLSSMGWGSEIKSGAG
jgi:hypothetical protein